MSFPGKLRYQLRRTLNNAFDDVELDAFCSDHFTEVWQNKFSRGMQKVEKLTILLDYCSTPREHQRLLNALQIYDHPDIENFLHLYQQSHQEDSPTPEETTIPSPEQLPGDLYDPIYWALLECEQFNSNPTIRDLFVDARIHQWRYELPDADSPAKRAKSLIAFLYERHHNETEENALVLFLQVLSDYMHELDQRHVTLKQLADQLASKITNNSAATVQTPWHTGAIRQLLIEALDDQTLMSLAFDYFRPVYEQFSEGLTRNRKVQLLIEYCERHNQIESLLNQIKRLNAAQYNRHKDNLTKERDI